jgi:tetratricopeptide (TPR) repeat protein
MWQFAHCLEPTNTSPPRPTTSTLPMTIVQAPEGDLPFADRTAQLAGGPPPELWLTLIVVAACVAGARWCRAADRPVAWGIAVITGTGAAGLLLVMSLVWITLHVAAGNLAAGDHAGTIRVARSVEPMLAGLRWVDAWADNPAAVVGEAASTAGMRAALGRGDLAGAAMFAVWPTAPRTPVARRTRAAAFSATAARALSNRQFDEALDAATSATAADPSSTVAAEGVATVRLHLAIELVDEEHYTEAGELLAALPFYWEQVAQAQAIGHLARQQIIDALDRQPSDPDAALVAVDAAWARLRPISQAPRTLHCDSAAVKEQLAVKTLAEDDPAAAVTWLMGVETHILGSPLADELWPDALHLRALREIAGGDGNTAITTLEQALQRNPSNPDLIRHDLVAAWVLRSAQEAEQHRFQAALGSAERAHELGRSPETAGAIDAVRLGYAEWSMQTGSWNTARAELAVLRDRPQHAADALARLAELDTAAASVARVHRVGQWAPLPARVAGRVAVDADGDGTRDTYLFADDSGVAVAWASLGADDRQVAFPDPLDRSRLVALLRDTNGNSAFDECQWVSGRSTTVVMDVDDDDRPDVRLAYEGDRLVAQEALSGRLLVRIVSAAIAGEDLMDAPWAGDIDPYFVVTQSGVRVARSATVNDSRFPSWNEGTVLDYRHADLVRVELLDEDAFFDDALGEITWATLPRSGYFRTTNGKAAVEVKVDPTDLPIGYRFVGPPVENAFRHLGASPDLSALRDIAATASRIEARVQLSNTLVRLGATELLVWALVPEAGFMTKFATGLGLDMTVGDALIPIAGR